MKFPDHAEIVCSHWPSASMFLNTIAATRNSWHIVESSIISLNYQRWVIVECTLFHGAEDDTEIPVWTSFSTLVSNTVVTKVHYFTKRVYQEKNTIMEKFGNT
ncbi:hypothetical protein Glove_499g58 [Diversispora epigaea]|uniref:Uncharacterized protein n=1 Tax=Diversispora epigaea TaxID=1348612 RepID=A0A397GQW0_9GLOM|nr:hypothetical protein Glove_499g58 [Diversispora epigaea]